MVVGIIKDVCVPMAIPLLVEDGHRLVALIVNDPIREHEQRGNTAAECVSETKWSQIGPTNDTRRALRLHYCYCM